MTRSDRQACGCPVGRVAIVADPFGNRLVLVDLSKGHHVTDQGGRVTGVVDSQGRGATPGRSSG